MKPLYSLHYLGLEGLAGPIARVNISGLAISSTGTSVCNYHVGHNAQRIHTARGALHMLDLCTTRWYLSVCEKSLGKSSAWCQNQPC